WGPRAIGDHGAPVSLPKLKKSYEKGTRGISWGPLLTRNQNSKVLHSGLVHTKKHSPDQGWTDNSWGPQAIGDHGAPVSLPKLKKAYEKGTRGISWGPLLTPGPQAVPEFPNGQFPWSRCIPDAF
ncbi:unnamed protein product, partial [Staurois parvus]